MKKCGGDEPRNARKGRKKKNVKNSPLMTANGR
jgi:hypothetical protein